MKTFKLNLIPGDGIGVDVIREGCRVLKTLESKNGGIRFDFNNLEWSCQYYLKTGRMMPADGMKILEDCARSRFFAGIAPADPCRIR